MRSKNQQSVKSSSTAGQINIAAEPHGASTGDGRPIALVNPSGTDVSEFQPARTCYRASIASLSPEPLTVLKPLNIVVRQSGGDFLATFVDANINASGDTEAEAVSNLKDMVAATFDLLTSAPQETLGPAPKRQLGVLLEFLRRSLE